MLPNGPYDVTGVTRMGREDSDTQFELSGFVDFGAAADGTECEADYRVKDVSIDHVGGKQTVVLTRRTAGGPSWSADASKLDPGASDSTLAWEDSSNPSQVGFPVFFIPSLIAMGATPGVVPHAGTDWICSIGVMPRFVRAVGEYIVLDAPRVRQTVRAAAGQWAEGFFTAAGAKDNSYSTLAAEWVASDFSGFDSLEPQLKIKVERLEGGVLKITQLLHGFDNVVLTFTPAADREVTAPVAKTYFENIAERAKTEDTQKIIADEKSKL